MKSIKQRSNQKQVIFYIPDYAKVTRLRRKLVIKAKKMIVALLLFRLVELETEENFSIYKK